MTNVAFHEGRVFLAPDFASQVSALNIQLDMVEVRGKELPSLPHTAETVTLLRNLGATMPTGMGVEGVYKFTGRHSPYVHQKATADFLASNERAFCLNSPGTGKTASAIWAADYLMQIGAVRRAIIFCPLSCVESVWGDELFSVAPHRSATVLVGPTKTRRSLFTQGSEFIVANHDATKTLHDLVEDPENEVDLVIIDESTAYKNGSAQRTKRLMSLCKGRRVWAMTGTPMPQNPVDAHTMCRLINNQTPPSKTLFQSETMYRAGPYKWLPRPEASEIVAKYMQPAIRYEKKDCLDMPDVVHTDQRVPLTKKQEKFIGSLKEDWVADSLDESSTMVVAANAAVRLTKVLQTCLGAVRTNIETEVTEYGVVAKEGEESVVAVDASTRFEACLDLIEQSESKTLVFVPFRAPMENLAEWLESKGVTCGVIHGDVPEAKRRKLFSEFQNQPDPKVLVLHPRVASHGLTLTAASTTVWFGPPFSAEIYEQANNRTNRPGQDKSMRIVNLWGDSVESTVYKGLKEKQSLQQLVLDTYRREVE